jgi:hypothetical protein
MVDNAAVVEVMMVSENHRVSACSFSRCVDE